MNISSIEPIKNGSYIDNLNYISGKGKIGKNLASSSDVSESGQSGFDSILQSFVNMIKDTDSLTKNAEREEIRYAEGDDNTLELLVAQNKANLSLSYTVAVRDKVLDAYKEIMNMQF